MGEIKSNSQLAKLQASKLDSNRLIEANNPIQGPISLATAATPHFSCFSSTQTVPYPLVYAVRIGKNKGKSIAIPLKEAAVETQVDCHRNLTVFTSAGILPVFQRRLQ
ncbi:hypothetical protein OUZ56_020432 [Daphnia magna]|uniref:Uncharacterized protein n=1 Tax=Daphnia magna TaxID=35525 RepID=A0ABQ9ZEG4_9CRUS|nr:hypothetical protein OUZ56_020432 [Daphnia magna]